METAVFGGGCFWCTEAIFSRIKGVFSVTPGYAGGKISNPDYESVSMGNTGHAETIKILFDPKIISYEKLLQVFWYIHNPTSLNKQENDEGAQYRSIILYTSLSQKEKIEEALKKIQRNYDKPIVTEIVKLDKFYNAESYHQKYFSKNPTQPYCNLIISPKITRFEERFEDLLK